jgi:PhzF family phenazine biosynthesis protein
MNRRGKRIAWNGRDTERTPGPSDSSRASRALEAFSEHRAVSAGSLHRLAAFTTARSGGNPAGVWVGPELPPSEVMQRIAAEVGYSETAFVAPESGFTRTIRYFSPKAEVPFCGHATIAVGVLLGQTESPGVYLLTTAAGDVPVEARMHEGRLEASLTSVEPRHLLASPRLLGGVLSLLGWRAEELEPSIPPAKAYAGAWHLVLAAAASERLTTLDYDLDALAELMHSEDLTTLQLVWREQADLFHSRNAFPVGGVVEDPATGAAAAALGGYLRDAGLLPPPAQLVIRQGEAMGQPSRIRVTVPASGGIVVTGTAAPIEG